jgi:hypothetical protein
MGRFATNCVRVVRLGEAGPRRAYGRRDAMAMILDFRSRNAREPRDQDETSSAEIIIFPGVRRERHAEAQHEAEPVRHAEPQRQRRRDKARPKRDRLEIPD